LHINACHRAATYIAKCVQEFHHRKGRAVAIVKWLLATVDDTSKKD
jgi:hypothetical protein